MQNRTGCGIISFSITRLLKGAAGVRLFAVSAAIVIIGGALVIIFKRKGWSSKRLAALAMLAVSLLCAWILQDGNELPLTSRPLPFYKLFNLAEYGYQSVLSDLVNYALPYAPAGFFAAFAFPVIGIGIAAAAGLIFSLLFHAPALFGGAAFVSDVYVHAALGMAAGAALFVLAAHLARKKSWFAAVGAAAPSKGRFRASAALLAIIYLGVAFVMIADYGEQYGELYLHRNDVPLPEIVVETSLESDVKRAPIYATGNENPLEAARRLAEVLGMEGEFAQAAAAYVIASPDGGLLTFDATTTWTYEFQGLYSGAAPDVTQAEEAARAYFEERDLLSGMRLGKLIDAEVVTNEHLVGPYDPEGIYSKEIYDALLAEAKKPVGADLLFRLNVGGHDVIGSNEISVSVRGGDTVTRIRKNDPYPVQTATKGVIPPQEAWDKFQAGEGSHTLYEPLVSAALKGVSLCYMLEARGNYLPVWMFELRGNNDKGDTIAFEAYVSALK